MLSADKSKSILMNIPITVILVSGLRILFNEVEFRWKVHNARPLSYLSHLEKKQLSPNDSRLSTTPPSSKWKRKIDSPAVEDAMQDFINKLLQDFVIDLWYSDISPDKEAPELIRAIIMDVLGEVSGRVKEVNLVDLLTRRNQTAIGVDVMGTLSSEERDERLKHHLLLSMELHPALISSECEYKDKGFKGAGSEQSPVHDHAISAAHGQNRESPLRKKITAYTQGIDKCLFRNDDKKELSTHASRSSVSNTVQDEFDHYRSSDWARVFEAAT
ncbi:Intermediate filament [Olea europaea subsp. europaea]|uniref:Intermediate filament n=1 Tax=Olea europaea subsp. europaea TaxID=158383 RepID=A0A8S0VGH2_OLEEU|nr:Intermediate filament [Olea europaea subsp. europaea]